MNKFAVISCCLLLGGCSSITDSVSQSWHSLWDDEIPKQDELSEVADNRIDIMREELQLTVQENALLAYEKTPPQTPHLWHQEGGSPAQSGGHINAGLLKEVKDEATIGDGHDWLEAALPASPIVSESLVFAMDGQGIITAHKRSDIDDVVWRSAKLKSSQPLLISGLAYVSGRLFAASGEGNLVAFNASNGSVLWGKPLGTPLRSSIRLATGALFVVTIDSQLLCIDAANGAILWQHRAIGETASLFGSSLPAIEGDNVAIAYQSGELFMLERRTGDMVWADMLQRPRRTAAISSFSGIDANPVIANGRVFAATSNGVIVADDVRSGARLWEQPLGTRDAPWVQGERLYTINQDNTLMGVSALTGEIGWMRPLAYDEKVAPRFFGPYVSNDTVTLFSADGDVYQYSPDGVFIRRDTITDSIAADPAFADSDTFILTRDATLVQVR